MGVPDGEEVLTNSTLKPSRSLLIVDDDAGFRTLVRGLLALGPEGAPGISRL